MLHKVLSTKLMRIFILLIICFVIGITLTIILLLRQTEQNVNIAYAAPTYSGYQCQGAGDNQPDKRQVDITGTDQFSVSFVEGANFCYEVIVVSAGDFSVINKTNKNIPIYYSIVGGGGRGGMGKGSYTGGGGGAGGVIKDQTYTLAASSTVGGNRVGQGAGATTIEDWLYGFVGGSTVLFGSIAGGGGAGGNGGGQAGKPGGAANGSGGGGSTGDDNGKAEHDWVQYSEGGAANGSGGRGENGKLCRKCNVAEGLTAYQVNYHQGGGGGGAGGYHDAWGWGGPGVNVSNLWTSRGISGLQGVSNEWGGGGGAGISIMASPQTAAVLSSAGLGHNAGGGGNGAFCQDDDTDECDNDGWGTGGNGGGVFRDSTSGQSCTGGGGGGGSDFTAGKGGGSGCVVMLAEMQTDANIEISFQQSNVSDVIYGSENYYAQTLSDLKFPVTFTNTGVYTAKEISLSSQNNFIFIDKGDTGGTGCKYNNNNAKLTFPATLIGNQSMTCYVSPKPINGSVKLTPGTVNDILTVDYKKNDLIDTVYKSPVVIQYDIISPELKFTAQSTFDGQLGAGNPVTNGVPNLKPNELGRTLYARTSAEEVNSLSLTLPRDYTDQERIASAVRLKARNTATNYVYDANSTVTFSNPDGSQTPDTAQLFELSSSPNFNSGSGSNISCSYGLINASKDKDCYLIPKKGIPTGTYEVSLYVTESNTRNFMPANDTNNYNPYYVNSDRYNSGKVTITLNVAESKLKVDPIIFEDQLMGYEQIATIPIKISNNAVAPVYNPQILAVVNTNNTNFIMTCNGGTKSGNSYTHPLYLENGDDDYYDFTDMVINAASPAGDMVNVGSPVEPCNIRPKAGLKPGKYWTSVHVLDRMSRATYVIKFTVIGPDIRISLPSFDVQNIGYPAIESKSIIIRNVGPVFGDIDKITVINNDEFDFHCEGAIADKIGNSGAGLVDETTLLPKTYRIFPDEANVECSIKPRDGLGQGTYVTPVQVDYNDVLVREVLSFRVGSSYLSITQPQFDDQDVGYTNADTGEKAFILNNTGNSPITDIEVRLQDACPFELVNPPTTNHLSIDANSKNDTAYIIRPVLNLPRGTYSCKISTTYMYANISLLTVSSVAFTVTAPQVIINIQDFGNVDGSYIVDNSVPEDSFHISEHPISINNIGDSVANISDVSISNTDSFELACKNNTSMHSVNTFTPEEQCNISPKQGLPSGAYMTTVSVTYSSLRGLVSTVTASVSINILSSDIDFDIPIIADATVGYSVGEDLGDLSRVDIRIFNRGNDSAQITAVYLDGDNADKFDILTACIGETLGPGSGTVACSVAPIEGLMKGTYTSRLTVQSGGAKTSKLITFTVLAPQIEVAVPNFNAAIYGYTIISDIATSDPSKIGTIDVTNVGDAHATINITSSNASEFEVVTGSPSVSVNETNSSWRVLPKLGLTPGEHSTNIIVTYGQNLHIVAKVLFKVVATDLKIEVPKFDDLPIGYHNYDDDSNAKDIIVRNIAQIDGTFSITINDGDWTLISGNSDITKNSVNSTWKLRPNANLPAGVHTVQVIVFDDITGAEFRDSSTFTVLSPRLVIQPPTFDTVEQDYASIPSSPADGVISIRNNGDTTANNISITATSADIAGNPVNDANIFIITQGNNSLSRNATDQSWRILPKLGLPSGEYYSTITLKYNALQDSEYYFVSADVSFHVMSSKLSIEVGDFLPRDINYNPSEVRQVKITNTGLSNGQVDITINNTNHFNLIGNCNSVLVMSNGGTYSDCKLEPKLNLLIGIYTTVVKVTDIKSREFASEKVSFEVKGASISLTSPTFDDEVINYRTYDDESSAKPLIVHNNGYGSTTINVRLDSGKYFELVHDYQETDHNFLGTVLGNPINNKYLIKPKSGLGAGVWRDIAVVTNENTGDEYFAQISFTVHAPRLEILNEDFPDVAAGLISDEYSTILRLRNNGDVDATHISASIACMSSGVEFSLCKDDEFILTGPTQHDVVNAPESEWVRAPKHADTDTPWTLSLANDIHPGVYYVRVSFIDLNSLASVDKVLKIKVNGLAFNLSVSIYKDIIVGYDNSEFSTVRVVNNSVIPQVHELSISDAEHFYIGKIKQKPDASADLADQTEPAELISVCDPNIDEEVPLDYPDLRNAHYLDRVTTHLQPGQVVGSVYCIGLMPAQARGYYATSVYTRDLNTGISSSVDLQVRALAPVLNAHDDNPAVRNIVIPPEVLSYTDTVKIGMEYNNLGDAKGFYSVKVLDSKDFELVSSSFIEPFSSLLKTPIGASVRVNGLAEHKAMVEPFGHDYSISIRPKLGLNPGTYFATLCVSYSAYESALEDGISGSDVGAQGNNGCVSTGLENRGIVAFTKLVSFVVQSPRYEITPVRFSLHNPSVGGDIIVSNSGDTDSSAGATGNPNLAVAAKSITIENTGNATAKIKQVYTKTDAFTVMRGSTTIESGKTDESWFVMPNRATRASSFVDTITFVDETGVSTSVPMVFSYSDIDLDDLPSLFIDLPAQDFGDLLNVYDASEFFSNVANNSDNMTDSERGFFDNLALSASQFFETLGAFPWWWLLILLAIILAISLYIGFKNRYFRRHIEALHEEIDGAETQSYSEVSPGSSLSSSEISTLKNSAH